VATQTIVILDFGSQYTQLIARRIREQNVFSVVLPCTAPLSQIQDLHPLGIVLSGGPSSVYDANAPAADPKLLELGVPVLGICYGLQFIVHHLGGKVRSASKREYGNAEVTIEDGSTPLFAGLPPVIQVWMSHGDEALELPERGAPHLGRAVPPRGAPYAAGAATDQEFHFCHLRRARRLDPGALYRIHGRGHSRQSRQGSRDLRPFWRRGFVGGGGAGAQGHR
jgi:GMP synthase (glutamine-hydrolysing) A subunit